MSSHDRAATFVGPTKLNSEDFSSWVGPRYLNAAAAGKVDFGSRLGLLAEPGRAYIAWADSRNALGVGDEVGGPTSQDVYVTEVRIA